MSDVKWKPGDILIGAPGSEVDGLRGMVDKSITTNQGYYEAAGWRLYARESTAKPAPAEPARVATGGTERKLAEGWERVPADCEGRYYSCTLPNGDQRVAACGTSGGARYIAPGLDGYPGACTAHAEAMGVFAKDERCSVVICGVQCELAEGHAFSNGHGMALPMTIGTAIPGADLRDAIWGGGRSLSIVAIDETTNFTEADWHRLTRIMQCKTCTHIHDIGKPCNGRSPNGHFSCPCGHERVEAKREVRLVGDYSKPKPTDSCTTIMMESRDYHTGATAALLANLEREKAPKRELPKVRDIYAPGVMLEEP